MRSFSRSSTHALLTLTMLSTTVGSALAAGRISRESFGRTPDGSIVYRYTLTNRNGMRARIMTYGGILTSLEVPDSHGRVADVVLGYSNLAGYLADHSTYFGALIGRYGNRIANGRFTLDGNVYHLPINNAPNSLHGGLRGFDKRIWAAQPVYSRGGVGLRLTYLSRDGEEGYPGNLWVTAIYTLTDANALRIDYSAHTDRDTVLNLTNHSYWNLAGAGNGSILDHRMMINADHFTPVNKVLIPTGVIAPVAGTPFDFRKPWPIGARIHTPNEQLNYGRGYDHNFVLNHHGNDLVLAARVSTPRSSRVLEVYTTQPGVQFYSGNFLNGTNVGKGHKAYQFRYGFALETQHYPDSPNHPDFPTTELKPGQVFHSTTIYRLRNR